MEYRAALYIRLSREDGGRQSAGIESQRLLLQNYARQRAFDIKKEYVDDGYSGTKYDRPAFGQMLADIESGEINLVLVKDLSRLGRNYIATGELTEVYFPEHGVRLIAVNDGYDSEQPMDDITPFRHVMNEMYARDISRKIRTALRAKAQDGQYIGSFAPYGYRKSEENKHTLVPDEDAAVCVRQIFRMAAQGYTTKEITEVLNQKAIPIPLDYRKMKRGKEMSMRPWTPSGVCKILRNPVYLGHTVQGKTEKRSLKSQRSTPKPKHEWIVVKHTHEPLVSEELFWMSQRRTPKKLFSCVWGSDATPQG